VACTEYGAPLLAPPTQFQRLSAYYSQPHYDSFGNWIPYTNTSTIRIGVYQVVIKRRRLSWLTNSAQVYEPKYGGGGGIAGTQPTSTAVTWSPNKFSRSNSIFDLWPLPSSAFIFELFL
jgi:hypothetical protein